MIIFLYCLLALLSIVCLFWLFLFIFLNDFSIPTIDVKKIRRILIVFPHPDDEVLTLGGFMRTVSDKKVNITHLILTKGEKGNLKGVKDNALKKIREKETFNAAKILNTHQLIIKDYGDGQLENKKGEIKKELDKIIRQTNPDLVISYDLTGLYGHPDHIACSQITTALIKDKFPNTRLWYVSFPRKIMNLINLPEHMAKEKDYAEKRVFPTHKIFVGVNVLCKIKAVRTYKSQYESFKSGIPIKFIPMEFFHSIALFEYFHEVMF